VHWAQHDLILKKITGQFPTLIIDKTKVSNNSSRQKIKHYLYSDLFVLIEDASCFDRIKNDLSTFSELTFSVPRPKLLFIVAGNTFITKNNFKKFFVYAWSLKFLDFSVIVNHTTIFSYDSSLENFRDITFFHQNNFLPTSLKI